jgi:hypothetical protein
MIAPVVRGLEVDLDDATVLVTVVLANELTSLAINDDSSMVLSAIELRSPNMTHSIANGSNESVTIPANAGALAARIE